MPTLASHWDSSVHRSLPAGGIEALQVSDDLSGRTLAGRDSEGKLFLLVRLAEGERAPKPIVLEGFRLRTAEWGSTAGGLHRYAELTCAYEADRRIFEGLCADLCGELGRSARASQCVDNVVVRWRHFWRAASSGLLELNRQIGLLAELHFLLGWVLPTMSVEEALAGWTAPHGSRHDFAWGAGSIEVKATLRQDVTTHVIHGLDQLELPESGWLGLHSVTFAEEPGGRVSLADVIQQLRVRTASSAVATDDLNDALELVGWNDAAADTFGRRTWRIVKESLYSVRDGFPRLTPRSFVDGLPSAIQSVSYELDLAGCDDFRVANQPCAFQPLLLTTYSPEHGR